MSQEQPITITFPDGQTASKIVDLVVRNKPIGWSRRSYASYYKPHYAEWLKRDIDRMIADRQPMVYRYDMFPSISKNSLYARVNQATSFLLDFLDKDGIYRRFFQETKTERIRNVGISIHYDVVTEGEVRAERFIGESETPKWKQQLDAYLEDDDNFNPWHKTGLLLSEEQQDQLKIELSGLTNVAFVINSREIKVIKGQ